MQLLFLALVLGTAYLQTAQAVPAPSVTNPPSSSYTTTSCTSSTCATYTNNCGGSYGGCYLDPSCGGTVPVWHPPPCPVTNLSARAATTATCSTSTCATYTNSCGATYGGCFLDPACGGTAPVWHPPLCPVTTFEARAVTTAPTTTTTTATCSTSTCATYTNDCGATYGGCFLDPACGGAVPTFHPPLCPVADAAEPAITSPPTITPTATSCDYSRCVDYINSCGQTYGGCFLDPACGGTVPVFHEPLCPVTVSSTIAAGCPYAECATSTNACGAALTTCFLAVACGGTTPPVQTSTCTRDWTSESMTEVYTTVVPTTTVY